MPNPLSADICLKIGPIVLGTFFKHYLNRASTSSDESERSSSRKQDLLWHEAFQVVKWFMEQSTKHTLEDFQQFGNAGIPTPPWIYVEKVLIPMSVCDIAAVHLIKAFGGADVTKRVVGGTKWWQIRGIRGVDCQWICQKSHLEKGRKAAKSMNPDMQSAAVFSAQTTNMPFPKMSNFSSCSGDAKKGKSTGRTEDSGQYKSNTGQKIAEDAPQYNISCMDGTRCMLYAHGGGYYFGSIDQTRYVMQRYARKINGRVFAVNYRLAPQYPFPCALQDLLAAYIYLINPPPRANHTAVPPHLIAFGGDSAGAGLCLAALQIIRDSGLPAPAAAVLVSPWCDLTHSFPSTVQNTATDIIPPYGLSLHKPSVLWPPPTDEMSSKVRKDLQEHYGTVAKRKSHVENITSSQRDVNQSDGVVETDMMHIHEHAVTVAGLGLTPGIATARTPTSIPPPVINVMDPKSGKIVPQSLRICGHIPLPWESEDIVFNLDNETLQTSNQIHFYCPNNLLLHPLISPVLSYLGGLPPLMIIASDKEVLRDEMVYLAHKAAHPDRYPTNEHAKEIYPPIRNPEMRRTFVHLQIYDDTAHVLPLFSFITPAKYCYRAIASFIKQFVMPEELPQPPIITASPGTAPEAETLQSEMSAQETTKFFPPQNSSSLTPGEAVHDNTDTRNSSDDSGDIAGNRFKRAADEPQCPGTAGHPSVYAGLKRWPPDERMIRERVSFQGVIRQLEPESEIPALSFPADYIGVFLEPVARRYIEGQALWAKKFATVTKTVEFERKKHLELAKGECLRAMDQFQEHLFHDLERPYTPKHSSTWPILRTKGTSQLTDSEPDRNIQTCLWAYEGEHPPRSSIVSRRDTAEARHLARTADLRIEPESRLSGNRLWSVLVNFLTTRPNRKEMEETKENDDENGGARDGKDRVHATLPSQAHYNEESPSKKSSVMTRVKSLGRRHPQRTQDIVL